jgi:hypothetical protein
MVIAICRGLRVDKQKLSQFALKHKKKGIQSVYVMDGANEGITEALHSYGMDKQSRVRIILPPSQAPNGNPYVFVAYDWNYVFGSKEVDAALPKEEPKGFRDAANEIDPDAQVGTWVVQAREEIPLLWRVLSDSASGLPSASGRMAPFTC